MSCSPRYVIAKYTSDLQRMEPRNIGVIVWNGSAVSAKFLAEKSEHPGDIDGRSVPPFVTSTSAYKQWIEYWRFELDAYPPYRESEHWLETLSSARGNFWLSDGGVILESVNSQQLEGLTVELFHRLVEPTSTGDDQKDVALDDVADRIIKSLRLTNNKNFHSKFEVCCQVGANVTERFEFSHAYKNGHLKRLYQRVPLSRHRAPLRRTVHDSAWMFEKVIQQGLVQKDQAVALVYAPEDHRRDPEIGWSLEVLGTVARVANLANQAEALSAFSF